MIDVAFTVEEVPRSGLAGVTAVVIDVVRASTTIVTALANGAHAVIPLATPAEAMSRASGAAARTVVLGGERGGEPPPGFDCGNSPAEYTAERVRGRTVLFTTSNGTRALLAVDGAKRIGVAGFVNADAVRRWLLDEVSDVLLVCAGESGRFCLEDATCAGLLVAGLRAARPGAFVSDSARAAAILYDHYAADLRWMLDEAAWAQRLVALGRGGDLPLCGALDVSDVVPVLSDAGLVAVERGARN